MEIINKLIHMKRLQVFFLITLFAFQSCTKKGVSPEFENNQQEEPAQITFSAYSEAKDSTITKTILTENGQIDWLPGDAIHVFKGTTDLGKFTTDITVQSHYADFNGRADTVDVGSNAKYWATYPYWEMNKCDGYSIKVSVPDTQTASNGSFDRSAFVSVAQSDDNVLFFYNVCGGVKLSVRDKGVTKIVFSGNNEEVLAGTALISFNDGGKPIVKEVIDGKKTITLTAPGDTVFQPGSWYYLSVLPALLAGGFTVHYVGENSYSNYVGDLTIDKSIEIKRGVWGRVNCLEDGSESSINVKDNVITYTTIDGLPIEISSNKVKANEYVNGVGYITLMDWVREAPDLTSSRLKTISLPKIITKIPAGTFGSCENLTAVHLPSSLSFIGEYAFARCSSLDSLFIPNSVTQIDDYAFSGCSKLRKINIPHQLSSTGKDIFEGCDYLEISGSYDKLHLNKDDLSYYNDNFYGCPHYSLILADGLSKIPESAFKLRGGLIGITIPNSVISIGINAFYNSGLKSVVLSDNLISIGNSAFSGCSELQSIVLPESLESIGTCAFLDCTKLKSVVSLPKVKRIEPYTFSDSGIESINMPNVESVGERAFKNCVYLSSVTFPSSCELGKESFAGCSSLTSVNLPSRYTIAEGVFSGSGLTKIVIPGIVKTIAARAFSDCNHLTEVTYQRTDQNLRIGDYAFSNTALKSVSLASISNVGIGAFSGCTQLSEITIEGFYTTLSDYIFDGCINLSNFSIVSSVNSIGKYAFRNCKSLKSLFIPQSVKLSEGVFCGCSGLLSVTPSIGDVPDRFFSGCINLKEVVIRGKSIGSKAFEACAGTRISLNEISSIASDAFEECDGLWIVLSRPFNVETHDFSEANSFNVEYSGSLATSTGTFTGCVNLNNVVLSEYINTIDDYAFENCTGLIGIDWKNVETIGTSAFRGTKFIKRLILPGVHSIGSSSFADCESLQQVIVPNVTSLGSSAFAGCSNLLEIELGEGLKIGGYTFSGCKKLQSIACLGEVIIYGNAFHGCESLHTVEINNLASSIKENAFVGCNDILILISDGMSNTSNFSGIYPSDYYGCSRIGVTFGPNIKGVRGFDKNLGPDYVLIPSTIVGIGDDAFAGCTNLKSVEFEEGIRNIGRRAFEGCASLTYINLPSTITHISDLAFRNSGLTSFVFPNSVTSVYGLTFDDCKNLKTITIGSGMTSIPEYFCKNCTALAEITIPETIQEIKRDAFIGCTGLKKVTVMGLPAPTCSSTAFSNTGDCPIYVPNIDSYLARASWSTYADRLVQL